MVILVTCKNEEDPIKNEGVKSANKIKHQFFRHSRAANFAVSGGILPKFKLIQAFMVVLVTGKDKMKALEC